MSERWVLEILICSLLHDFSGWGFAIGTEFQMHSWRLFIFVCLFPTLAALVGVVFMPESPRFLLEVRFSVARLKYARLKHLLQWQNIKTCLSVLIKKNSEMPQKYLDIHSVSLHSLCQCTILDIKLWLVKNVESSDTTGTSHCCAKVAKGC